MIQKDKSSKLSLAVISLIACFLIMQPPSGWAGYSYTELLPPGWDSAWATDINNHGVVVGNRGGYDDERKGFIYSGGIYTELLPPGWYNAYVSAINDSGSW